MRGLTRGAVAVCVLAATGCASEREVTVMLPMTRLELPEPAPRAFGVGYARSEPVRLQLTPDQTTTAPDANAPSLSHGTDDEGILRLDWQPLPALMISLRNFSEDLNGVQLKWHAFSPAHRAGRDSLAFTVAFGRGDKLFVANRDGEESSTEVERSLTDIAMIYGWRFHPQWLVFGGPFHSRHDYDGDYISERGSDPDFLSIFSGTARLTGVNIGSAYMPADWFQWLAELSWARIQAGSSDASALKLSLALQFHMGRRFAPRTDPPPPDDPPVEVVPVE